MLHVLNVGFDLYLVVTKDEFNQVITAHQRSCGKVMFSQLCVCLFVRGWPCDHYPWCIGPHCTAYPHPQLLRMVTITADLFKLVHWTRLCSTAQPTQTSGDHQSTYSWQAVGTHPTEMLSCLWKNSWILRLLRTGSSDASPKSGLLSFKALQSPSPRSLKYTG